MLLTTLACLVLAKPWNGITPGVSSRDDVVHRFGEPSKVIDASGHEVLAYQKGKLIKGTTQTQFRIDSKTGVVERIDVFPEPVLTLEQIAQAYGPACTVEAPETAERPCYLLHDQPKKTYVIYVRLGLAVFFSPEGNTVQTFAFLPEKK
jgi:hypothetical protein